jgi:hypothetical protein
MHNETKSENKKKTKRHKNVPNKTKWDKNGSDKTKLNFLKEKLNEAKTEINCVVENGTI